MGIFIYNSTWLKRAVAYIKSEAKCQSIAKIYFIFDNHWNVKFFHWPQKESNTSLFLFDNQSKLSCQIFTKIFLQSQYFDQPFLPNCKIVREIASSIFVYISILLWSLWSRIFGCQKPIVEPWESICNIGKFTLHDNRLMLTTGPRSMSTYPIRCDWNERCTRPSQIT